MRSRLLLSDTMTREEIVELFNPFHDKGSGRFTTKQGGGAVSSGGTGDTKAKKAARVGGGAVGAVGGWAVGGIAGQMVGGLVGGVGAAIIAAGGGSIDDMTGFVDFATTVGGITGAVAGAAEGAKFGHGVVKRKQEENTKKKEMSGATDRIELQEAGSLKDLLGVFDAFLKRKEKRLAFKGKAAAGLTKIGFKQEGEYYYADRPLVEKLAGALRKHIGA